MAPDDRRALLLRHALAVFARRGLGGARHAEIAKDAGVSVAATFVYFPTREDLVDAVLAEVERFYLAQAEAIHAGTLPASRVLLEHARAFAASVASHPDYARVWLDWSTAFRDEVWTRYLAFQARMVRLLARTMRRGQRDGSVDAAVAVEDEAQLLFGGAHMVAQMQFTGVPPARLERFLKSLVRSVGGRLA
jgi:TetR/AcrR family hemagglutinin/protease transcriptional regulator